MTKPRRVNASILPDEIGALVRVIIPRSFCRQRVAVPLRRQ